MPTHPDSPSRRRRSSGFSHRPRTMSQSSLTNSMHSRKSSNHSLFSPPTPRTPTGFDHSGFDGLDEVDEGSTKGMGSLADELAAYEESTAESAPPSPSSGKKLKRTSTRAYDGSGYGEDDLEPVEGMSARLEQRIATVEALARYGAGDSDTHESGVVPRVREHLKNLSSQNAVEDHVSRLLKANVAVASNLAYQARLLISLTRPVVSPLQPLPDPDTAAELCTLLSAAIAALPHPSTTSVASLRKLKDAGLDLDLCLLHLFDQCAEALHNSTEARQSLYSSTKTVEQMRLASDRADEAQRWIERGRWEERLRNREAAKTCREVVEGFEKTCERWRERIARGAVDAAEVAAAS